MGHWPFSPVVAVAILLTPSVLGTVTVSVPSPEIESTTNIWNPEDEDLTDWKVEECAVEGQHPTIDSALLRGHCPPAVKQLRVPVGALTVQEEAFGSYTNLTSLRLDNNWLTDLPKKALAGLPALKSLSISGNRLRSVRSDVFLAVTHLEWLSLSENDIKFIQPDLLEALQSLTFLNLSWNRIASLEGNGLQALPRLQVLDLSYNDIAQLKPATFQALEALTELRLKGNLLHTLHGNTFAPLRALRCLDLSSNFFTTLPRRLLMSNRKLEELHLQRNRLESLSEDAFVGLALLDRLDLDENQLTNLAGGTFRDQARFSRLNLERNQLQHLDLNMLRTTEVLLQNNRLRVLNVTQTGSIVQSLMLYGNEIASIDQDAFRGLVSLETLYLDHNRITELPALLFRFNEQLHHVTISHNRLTVLKTNTFAGLARLHSIDLSYNELTTIEVATFHGSPVRYLNLNGNHLKALDERILSGTTLHYLQVDSNDIDSLASLPTALLSELVELSLRDNRIETLDELCPYVRNLPKLSTLDLSNNSLPSVGERCLGNVGTQTDPISVALGDNKLETVPAFVGRILSLDLSRNNVTALDGYQFRWYQGTEKLLLRGAAIEKFRAVQFTFLVHLKHLEIGSERLEAIDGDAFYGRLLEHLTISGTPLRTMPTALLKSQHRLQSVSFAHNRLNRLASDTFLDCQQLTNMDLSFNELEAIDPLWFKGLLQLKVVNLERNQLTVLPALPTELSLDSLSLANNRVSSVSLLREASIRALNISHNNLTHLPELSERTTQLDVSGNGLKQLTIGPHCQVLIANSNQIQSLHWLPIERKFELQHLEVSDNLLTEVDGRLFDLRHLSTVDLAENRLSSFPFAALHRTKHLRAVNLSRNNIRRLPDAGVPRFRLDALDLSENPLEALSDYFLNVTSIHELRVNLVK
ncbi:protein artichoke-like [Anopheles bellator]|uniref:protein artichoke-like n=1 Tax=Anopheles bellator TaxID=139047 RepID=UPI002648DCC0|nr:protein artichoke-like [Anopheles bellator]